MRTNRRLKYDHSSHQPTWAPSPSDQPRRYWGNFQNYEDVLDNFRPETTSFPAEDDVICAAYDLWDYEGYAYVLYRKRDQLFEVYASHCSCYGLEGQWEPERTSKELLLAQLQDKKHSFHWHLRSDDTEDSETLTRAQFLRIVEAL